jgi:glycosyltransferase involved in cell wall biosynthesis
MSKKLVRETVNITDYVGVCIPAYFGTKLLPTTIKSLLDQTHQNFKVYVRDDTPPEASLERLKTEEYIKSLNDDRFTYIANSENRGYPRNLIALIQGVSEEIIFLLAQDDVLSPIAIESCVRAFIKFPNSAAVARPYYWYFDQLNKPVRQIRPLEGNLPHLITLNSDVDEILLVLLSVSQLTGLAYRKSMLTVEFSTSVFPAHIYPFAGAIRDHGVVYLPSYTVAVSIQDSQTRKVSSIYEESPAKAWVKLYETVFEGEKHKEIKAAGIRKHMGENYIGLVQIRTYAKYRYFIRECAYLIRIQPQNVVRLKYWFSVLALALLPRRVIQMLVDNYKTQILSKKLINLRLARKEDSWW